MAHIRKLSTGKFRVEIRKNYNFIASKTFISKQLAQSFADDMDKTIETILSLKPKKLKKLTPAKVEKLGGIGLFKKLGIKIEFMTFKILCDEYLKQWQGKDIVNQNIRVCYWL